MMIRGGENVKIGISSYSYSRLVKEGKMSQIDVVNKAREMGFDTIEFSTLILAEGEKKQDLAEKLRDECDKAGFQISNYTIGADFLSGSDGDLDAEIERVKEEVDTAKILNASGMRHDASKGFPENKTGARDFDTALPRLVKGCRAITEYAEQLGIKTMVENHGRFCQDSRRVEKLVCGVDHPNFGVLLDMGNFVGVDEDPGKAVGRLMPYTFHVHAKDFHLKPGTLPDPGTGWAATRGGNFRRPAIIGHGNVPILAALRVMHNFGYDGVLSIEFEGMEERIQAIQISHENLRSYVREVYKN